MQSSGNLYDELSEFVNYYIKSLSDKEDSSKSILVKTESVVEKLISDIINPCKTLTNCDVVGQETSRPSIAEIVDLKSPNKSIEATSSTSMLGGQQNKGNGAGCAATGLTGAQTGLTGGQPGLTAAPRLSQNKSKPKKVKSKKPEIGVRKTIESKGCKHQREKPKSNEKLLAKSQRQNNVNGASRSKNSKRPKPSPREKFHNENRQWSNSHKSMPFPPYGSSTPMPWEPYFNMHYFCPPWYYNSYMGSPSYFGPNYITHRESVINEPSPMRSDCFDHKNRSTQKNNRKVIK
jgi:hypothetical protein